MAMGIMTVLPPKAEAATITHETDFDFTPDGTGGSLSGVQVSGAGSAASVTLAQDYASWLNTSPSNAPSPRDDYGLAWDEVTDGAVLFGGYDGTFSQETWGWDGTDWSKAGPLTAPAKRARTRR